MPKITRKKETNNNGNGSSPSVKAKYRIAPSLQHMAVAVSSLVPDPLNARLHPERNLKAIKESLQTFGQVKPIVVVKNTRVVVAGNGTLEAAKELGWNQIAATFVDMDSHEAACYGVADNRTAELAKWDFETLAKLEELAQEGGYGLIGYSNEQLKLIRLAEWEENPDTGEDVEESYKVLVSCSDEQDQADLIEKLMKEGYECRALTL